jgi:hypothetical protein
MAGVEQGKNGKWAVSFDTFLGLPGAEYLANTATSAPVFETEDEALIGGARALTRLEETGRFPNMCEKF